MDLKELKKCFVVIDHEDIGVFIVIMVLHAELPQFILPGNLIGKLGGKLTLL